MQSSPVGRAWADVAAFCVAVLIVFALRDEYKAQWAGGAGGRPSRARRPGLGGLGSANAGAVTRIAGRHSIPWRDLDCPISVTPVRPSDRRRVTKTCLAASVTPIGPRVPQATGPKRARIRPGPRPETQQLAVMVDTFRPLKVTEAAMAIDDGVYYKSWVE